MEVFATADIVAGSSLDRQSALRYRSGTVRLVRAGAGGARASAASRAAAPAARRTARTRLQGGRPAGARGSCYHPRAPPSRPFIDTPALTPFRSSFICFDQKFGESLHMYRSHTIRSEVTRMRIGIASLIQASWRIPVGPWQAPASQPTRNAINQMNLTMNFSKFFW